MAEYIGYCGIGIITASLLLPMRPVNTLSMAALAPFVRKILLGKLR